MKSCPQSLTEPLRLSVTQTQYFFQVHVGGAIDNAGPSHYESEELLSRSRARYCSECSPSFLKTFAKTKPLIPYSYGRNDRHKVAFQANRDLKSNAIKPSG